VTKFDKFEEIVAWKKARLLVKDIYAITAQKPFTSDFGLRDQIRRASVSIMLNIAEGFARRTSKEFAQFLFLAHGWIRVTYHRIRFRICMTVVQRSQG
jgi:four helix bundle protein